MSMRKTLNNKNWIYDDVKPMKSMMRGNSESIKCPGAIDQVDTVADANCENWYHFSGSRSHVLELQQERFV